jgi:hypothetical protein
LGAFLGGRNKLSAAVGVFRVLFRWRFRVFAWVFWVQLWVLFTRHFRVFPGVFGIFRLKMKTA